MWEGDGDWLSINKPSRLHYVCDYENPWMYLERPFTSDDVRDYYGFVYLITNLSNQRLYIGRKVFWFHRKPPGKKRRVKKSQIGNCTTGHQTRAKEDVKLLGTHLFRREILSLHKSKGTANFNETELALFKNNVLTESLPDGTPRYYNSNIMNRYYRKDYFEYEETISNLFCLTVGCYGGVAQAS